MFRRVTISIVFIWVLAILYACKTLNPDEPVPAYLRIVDVTLSTNQNPAQGSSSKITDAWVYVNDNVQGVYPLPAKFPVLSSGSQRVSVRGGIIQNGIDATRIDYPFYNSWDTTIEFKSLAIARLSPVINGYKSGTIFHLIEDFESIGLSLQKTSSSPNDLYKTSEPSKVFEGKNAGKFEIIGTTAEVTIATINSYNLPKNGTKVFAELNYNINQPMEIGIMGLSGVTVTPLSVIGLRASFGTDGSTPVWKKVYVDLTEAISSQTTADSFKLYFYAKQEEGVTNPQFLIDNLKLLSF